MVKALILFLFWDALLHTVDYLLQRDDTSCDSNLLSAKLFFQLFCYLEFFGSGGLRRRVRSKRRLFLDLDRRSFFVSVNLFLVSMSLFIVSVSLVLAFASHSIV